VAVGHKFEVTQAAATTTYTFNANTSYGVTFTTFGGGASNTFVVMTDMGGAGSSNSTTPSCLAVLPVYEGETEWEAFAITNPTQSPLPLSYEWEEMYLPFYVIGPD
jgi:hypothetical protein